MPTKLTLRTLLAAIALTLLAACSDPPGCETACDNLEACGRLGTGRSDCVRACKEDPSVLDEDVRCISESTCDEMDACMQFQVPSVDCWRVCGRIYDGCDLALQGSGKPLDEDGCIALCRKEFTLQKVHCLERVGCGRIGECL